MKILKFEVKIWCCILCRSLYHQSQLVSKFIKFVEYDGVHACVPMHQISVAQWINVDAELFNEEIKDFKNVHTSWMFEFLYLEENMR